MHFVQQIRKLLGGKNLAVRINFKTFLSLNQCVFWSKMSIYFFLDKQNISKPKYEFANLAWVFLVLIISEFFILAPAFGRLASSSSHIWKLAVTCLFLGSKHIRPLTCQVVARHVSATTLESGNPPAKVTRCAGLKTLYGCASADKCWSLLDLVVSR